jgi:uncharacterized repeat protein (TIGR03803 family)
VLYSFGLPPDGNSPHAGLIDVQDTLYGTTAEGGAYGCGTYNCGGTVFSVTTGGTEKVLHSFGELPDGNIPAASLIDVNGTLYGTTQAGGAYRQGTVFSITLDGAEKVLHSFGNGKDGAYPSAGLISIKGTLYGTTSEGGLNGSGTVFSITTDGSENVLHSFAGGTDGAYPGAGLLYVDGTLYGTTLGGGVDNSCHRTPPGCGTVFSIAPDGTENVLHSFGKGADGTLPLGSLVDVKRTLYGTTWYGGAYNACPLGRRNGCGTVFSITTGGTEEVLHSFGQGTDGAYPVAGMIDVDGTLYGTTEEGGASGTHSYGTVFSITTGGTEKVVHNFGPSTGNDGFLPGAPLIDVKGTLYGTTVMGGAQDGGVVFALTP